MANSNLQIERSREILGRGGFSTVFKGRFDNKDVAVKRVLLEDVDSREEEFLTNYQHPNILNLFRAEEDDTFRQVSVQIGIKYI